MHAHRTVTVATLLVAAWLTSACQSSLVRPTALAPATPVPPTQELAVVNGLVFEAPAYPDGAPIPISGAEVSIMIDLSGTQMSATTDSNGWFEITPAKGTVTVTVTKEGYETLVTSMALEEDINLSLELKRAL